MNKICKNCGKKKDINSFYKKKASPDGYQSVCKICTGIITKDYKEKRQQEFVQVKKEKEDPKTLSLVGTCKKDYCAMYEAMNKLGYSPSNPEMDIHTQFMNKWSLKVSKSPRKGPENQVSYEDCCK
jgi:hypothetical protein